MLNLFLPFCLSFMSFIVKRLYYKYILRAKPSVLFESFKIVFLFLRLNSSISMKLQFEMENFINVIILRQFYHNEISDVNPQITPLTPPTSESSSSDVEFVSEAVTSHSVNTSTQKVKGQTVNQKSQKSKSAQVFGMTIFDAVMINDGRSKKGNGDAEVIHIEERRKGRYKCPQCGKQYATSSNLSRHKQTHRSLDSQSAKKCNTCGKAYVSMPALAMHLLTHKLTHSCDVCGKLFSRPWLLQGIFCSFI